MPDSSSSNSFGDITIRPLYNVEEYSELEHIQREVWAITDSTQVIPLHVLITAQKNGGLTAGAFDSGGRMVGFLFGFLGMHHGASEPKFKHCSHMMGIRPSVQRRNLGYQMKCFQRDYVRKQGLDLITWTFDPLESVNARLNISKLGTFCKTYHRNIYGAWNDGLNAGIPTDRFEVEWWISSPRVMQRIDHAHMSSVPTYDTLVERGAAFILQGEVDSAGVLRPGEVEKSASAGWLLMEIPAAFQTVKAASPEAALAWRMATREVFEHYFARGYVAAEFVSTGEGAARRNFYALTCFPLS
jgi:predicted GNAT superfamily acetyltransferase